MAYPQRKLTPEQELRVDLEWDLRLALRDGKDVIFQRAYGPESESAADAVYQDSIGTPALVTAYQEAVQAFARGDTYGRIGELFTEFMRQASAHYVETLASGVEDPEMRLRVTFGRKQ